jgi:prevent-host-death family protein
LQREGVAVRIRYVIPSHTREKEPAVTRRRDVKPITYLKSRTADLVREVHEGGRAVTITQNGEAKVVVMDVDSYDRWRSALALLKLIAQSEADVRRDRTVKQAEVFRRAEAALARQRRGG